MGSPFTGSSHITRNSLPGNLISDDRMILTVGFWHLFFISPVFFLLSAPLSHNFIEKVYSFLTV